MVVRIDEHEVDAVTDERVDPFEVDVSEEAIEDLRRRLATTRWPDAPPVSGWEYGADRDYVQTVCEYWREDFDWEAFESRLNRFDQYTTRIDGQRIHFYHIRSSEPDATPLLVSHGWPGSVAEFLEIFEPLSDPASHGGEPGDAFHVVAPSLPGYGFSGPTRERGYGIRRIAETFATLMERLGYDRYVAQGGDWGAWITAHLAMEYPDRVEAAHTNMIQAPPPDVDDFTAMLDEQELADLQETREFQETGFAYFDFHATAPQTAAYGLTDSPAGLAGWILDKFHAWSDCGDDLEESFERDRLLDTLSVYWLTGTINSSMRLYYETNLDQFTFEDIDVPTGHARYPAEIIKVPRSWVEEIYDVVHWERMPEGGHFAAMEVPDLFVDDLRTFHRKVR